MKFISNAYVFIVLVVFSLVLAANSSAIAEDAGGAVRPEAFYQANYPVGSILLEADYVYTSGTPQNPGNVTRYKKNEPRVEGTFIGGPAVALLGIVGDEIYYQGPWQSETLWKVKKTGGTPTQFLNNKILGNGMYVRAMAFDSQYIYLAVDDYMDTTSSKEQPAKILRIGRDSGQVKILATDGRAIGLVVAKGQIFWSDDDGIKTISLKNLGTAKQFVKADQFISDLTTDGNSIYWSDGYVTPRGAETDRRRTIKMKSVDGGSATTVVSKIHGLSSIALSQTSIYWIAEGDLYSIAIAGGRPVELDTGTYSGSTLAVDSGSVYVGNFGNVTVGDYPVYQTVNQAYVGIDGWIYYADRSVATGATQSIASTSGGGLFKVPANFSMTRP